MPPGERRVSAEFGIPFLKIGTDDVGALFRRRARKPLGPFLVVSVSSGLALDTALRTTHDSRPHLWPVHGQPHQLWLLRPTGHAGEFHLLSAANNLLLDGNGVPDTEPVRMRDPHRTDAAWQRWRVVPVNGGRAHRIENAGTGLVLNCPHAVEARTPVTLRTPHGGENQTWLLAAPFTALAED
ncbi:RICIN domain-containing protein [Kitasatospora sp. SolWspMP-SS2h]|uniref:RICIN domain-containing protein n=1 Tax=Kitasatospora sp. SolWspMP-SS2h TaxID=1305729 RepID=UPI0011B93E71|nr:RICIN domain-containing protein [Kitasatospora sp. SolWspMP-SS2h]